MLAICNCKNVGTTDRIVPAVLVIVALVPAFTTPGAMAESLWGLVAAVVGVVMLGTAVLGMWPL